MSTPVQIDIDENGYEVCRLPTQDERKQINEIQALMEKKMAANVGKVGGGWFDFLSNNAKTIDCKMKCHVMCGAMITLAVTGSAVALYAFYQDNQVIFQNAIEYVVKISEPQDKELADAVSNQEAGLKCFDKEFIEKKEEMNAIYGAIGEKLLDKIKTNFTDYYDELYNDLNNRYKFCPSEVQKVGGHKKSRRKSKKGKKSRKHRRK